MQNSIVYFVIFLSNRQHNNICVSFTMNRATVAAAAAAV